MNIWKRIWQGLCIAVLLLTVSMLIWSCEFTFGGFGNMNHVRVGSIAFEALNLSGDPVIYIEQPNNITCAATVACMIGNYYGFWSYSSDADVLQIHDAMTNGNPNQRATYGQFVGYCQSQFWQLNWRTRGTEKPDGIIDALPDLIRAGDPATLDGQEHIVLCSGVILDSAKYWHPYWPEKYVTDVIVADPWQRGRYNGGLTEQTRGFISSWMKKHRTAQGDLYLSFHRINFNKSLPEGVQYVSTESITSGHQDSYELQTLLRNRPWDEYASARDVIPSDDIIPPEPNSFADTMTCVAQVLMLRSGLLEDITQFPWLANLLANSKMTRAFQVAKVGSYRDMPDHRWFCQVITHANGRELTVGETAFDYNPNNKVVTRKWSALFATPYSTGIPRYSKVGAHFASADALMRVEDAQREYPGSRVIPFNDQNDGWPGELKWYISGGQLQEPIVLSRGGLQMVWDDVRQDYVFLEDVQRASGHGPVPSEYQLSQNFPNPFNPTTTITFSVPKQTTWTVDVMNILGERVKQFTGTGVGRQTITWNASTFASGVYFYKLHAGDFTETKKMVLMK